MAEQFFDQDIYVGEPARSVCADCGADGEPDWVQVTKFGDPFGQRTWVPSGRYSCPNGPHEIRETRRD